MGITEILAAEIERLKEYQADLIANGLIMNTELAELKSENAKLRAVVEAADAYAGAKYFGREDTSLFLKLYDALKSLDEGGGV